jgi:hypothetical protein
MLVHEQGGYAALPWTYPDYDRELRPCMNRLRELYLAMRRSEEG